jgi:hypothetical protein
MGMGYGWENWWKSSDGQGKATIDRDHRCRGFNFGWNWWPNLRSPDLANWGEQEQHSNQWIIVANDKGLLFKSEDGTPLLKVGKDGFGTHVRLLDPSGATLVELNTLQGTGGITVGSKNGGYAYVQAHEESSTITLLGKYNKEAVEITSATADGSGSLSINEGKKGYHAVEIGGGPNRVKSKGTITIPSDNGVSWQAP